MKRMWKESFKNVFLDFCEVYAVSLSENYICQNVHKLINQLKL